MKNSPSFLSLILVFITLFIVPLSASCAASEVPDTEEQTLQSLRQMTKDGKFPPESYLQQIESRFPNTKTGALAKLLRAQIRISQSDANGAADILNSDVFQQKTQVADYALWLRGKALQQVGRHAEAMSAFEQLAKDYPNSLRAREAKILWAQSALQTGQAQNVAAFLKDLTDKNDADALLAVAKSFEQQGNQPQAIAFYRKVYFYGAGTGASREAETKLTTLAQPLAPQTAEEIQTRAEKLYNAKNYPEAQKAFDNLVMNFPAAATPQTNLKRVITFSNLRKPSDAQFAFNLIPQAATAEKEQGYYELARAYGQARQWAQARAVVEEMRQKFPRSNWTPKTVIAAGLVARDQKNSLDETYFLRTAVANYPNAVEVAQAQFELAWLEHDAKNFSVSSQMLTEHLARYADKDTTYRGRAGYWAARDSERAGKIAEACALYDAVIYRYAANWYGYLAQQRIANLRALNKCQSSNFAKDSLVGKAIENLKTVTVAKEISTAKEQVRFVKAEQLSNIGLFDWAIDELNDAARTAPNSPKVNLAVAKLYRLRDDNTSALLALAKSYPDYSQMFPEEMSREEWDIFYPLSNWQSIKLWANNRNLDPYNVAGLIRQESVFNPRAKSGANAYGLMQLLVPTARSVAKKYGSEAVVTAETLFLPALNIELGTAYLRDQLDKFGKLEYVAAAYNAGPGRIPQWRATLPYEMDEFVEAIPFKETRGYVQGVIRNSAQYRRLYDENGNFKPNVGTRPLRGEIDSKSSEQLAQELPEVRLKEDETAE